MNETTISEKKRFGLSSSALHIIAMAFMLCDHAWATVLSSQEWLTCVGRIAFPIFAFMIVEGYFHTRSVKRYLLRLLIFALVSEIPFNLMVGGGAIYPFHQNVMFTFLISLALVWWIDSVRKKGILWKSIIISALAVLTGFIAGFAGMVDYYGFGVLTVLVFYFFRGKKWWCILGQIVCMYIINVEGLGGYYYPITIGGFYFELQQQGIALLALIPVWFYNGSRGITAKWFKYFCYAFYPAHILVLVILWHAL